MESQRGVESEVGSGLDSGGWQTDGAIECENMEQEEVSRPVETSLHECLLRSQETKKGNSWMQTSTKNSEYVVGGISKMPPTTEERLVEADANAESVAQEMLFGGTECEASKETTDAITESALMDMLERQEYKCALSGIPMTPQTARLDHKTARADDGEETIENVHWVHETVNDMKGTMSIHRFISLCRRVARWNR